MNRIIKNAACLLLAAGNRALAALSPGKVSLPTLDGARQKLLACGYAPYAEDAAATPPPPQLADNKVFTVIVPVYNSEAFLRKCLGSLLCQQTRYDYEVVCVNDGSTDGSLAILEALQREHPNRLVVVSQKNGGIAAARNKGITLARGRYIGFVDNDDTVAADYVEKLVNALETHGADMVQCGHRRVTPDGTVLYESHRRETAILDNDHSLDYNDQVAGFVWGGAYRKQMWSKVRFAEGCWYEDMLTKILLGRLSRRTVVLSDCLYDYTLTGSNSSDTLWKATSPHALDALYLPMRLFHFSNKELGLDRDQILDCMMVHELCWQLPIRADHIGRGVLRAAFVVVADFLRSNNIRVEEPRHSWRKLCRAALSGNYLAWKYTAHAEKWLAKMV